jgi:hypothetical protein
MTESYVCEQCGEPTAGDALCGRCLAALEQAAHPPFARASPDDAMVLARRVRDRLREHLALRPACPHCASHPTLLGELMDAEEASAEVVRTLERFAGLAQERPTELHPQVLSALAVVAKRWHGTLERLVRQLGGDALLAVVQDRHEAAT